MSLELDRIEAVERENDTLRERIKQLEAELGFFCVVPISLPLTGQESRLFGALMQRDLVTKDFAMMALYENRAATDVAEPKIVDVFICKLRKKLKPLGIDIQTKYGLGYFMDAAAKKRVEEMIPTKAAA